jgi:hypothetical protein
VIHNEFVNAYQVELRPHEATVLHRHDYDYAQVGIGNADPIGVVPGQPDSRRKVVDGEVQFGLKGSVHLSRNDSDAPYRTLAVEFFRPQGRARNGCVAVIAGLPLNCPETAAATSGSSEDRLQFETDQTRVYRTRVAPRQNMAISDLPYEELLVALDDALVARRGEPDKMLRAGEFLWIDRGAAALQIKNMNDRDLRLVVFTMKPLSDPVNSRAPGAAISTASTLP